MPLTIEFLLLPVIPIQFMEGVANSIQTPTNE